MPEHDTMEKLRALYTCDACGRLLVAHKEGGRVVGHFCEGCQLREDKCPCTPVAGHEPNDDVGTLETAGPAYGDDDDEGGGHV